MEIPEVEKKTLVDFKDKLYKNLGNQVEKVILFGSKARGDFYKESDIDILIVLHEKTTELENKIHDLIIQILLEYGVYLSVIIFSSQEYTRLNNIPTIFMQNVAREGIPL